MTGLKRTVILISALVVMLTIACGVIYSRTGSGLAFSLAITFGTISYHFLMRLAVGLIFNAVMRNRADLTKDRYRLREWEKRLYERLGVKRWKNSLPTFAPELFDLTRRSPEEVAQAMCQAELVHETTAALSLVPILFSFRFGVPGVFILTSIASFICELAFVAVQRFNRPRVMKLKERLNIARNCDKLIDGKINPPESGARGNKNEA